MYDLSIIFNLFIIIIIIIYIYYIEFKLHIKMNHNFQIGIVNCKTHNRITH